MRITNELIQAEQDILHRVADLPVNLSALAVASNIWRASQSFRLTLERTVLREYELTWSSFSTLFIIWVWGPIGMSAIAEHQFVSRPTVTSAVTQLEKRGYCIRQTAAQEADTQRDRRTVRVALTETGRTLIEEVFPKFNQGEADFVNPLTPEEQETLAYLLRKLVSENKQA
ncbi:MAG: MarR family transcriptional regulator [Chloroflexota bacterium]